MAEPVVCARAVITPENCVAETERLIAAALYHRRPVYVAFPTDYGTRPFIGSASPLPEPQSDTATLAAAAEAMLERNASAKNGMCSSRSSRIPNGLRSINI
jgi:indolepyruvate decarboxylase